MQESLDIPKRLLRHEKVTSTLPRNDGLYDRYTVSRDMIDWMHEQADQPFRFSPSYGSEGEVQFPNGCKLYGSAEDLMLFRIKFGF